MEAGAKIGGLWGRARLWPALALALLAPAPGLATTTPTNTTSATYSSTATGNVGTSGASCVSRTFAATGGELVDGKIGLLVTHERRSELRATLRSPAGTTVTLMDGNGGSAQNVNIQFDEKASSSISSYTGNVGNDSMTAPPYQRTYRPAESFLNFLGEDAAGTWTLQVCDLSSNSNTGMLRRIDLTIVTAPNSDLSLTKTVNRTAPASGSSIAYTLTLASASGSTAASNVTVKDLLPAGVSFVSSSGYGSYDRATGIWTVPSIAAGTTRTLTINALVTASAGAPIRNVAEIWDSPVDDKDSTPGNGDAGEDDFAIASFTVSGSRAAGTAPNLACPAGKILFDWDTKNWNAGSTSNSYAVSGLGTVSFALSNPGAWLNLSQLGGVTPRVGSALTGGYSPSQDTLIQGLNMANRSQAATTVITLSAPAAGAQFRIFDVDYNEDQFADRVRITGSLNGSNVLPQLTNGVNNYVIGNEATGDVTAEDDTSFGNVVVTFSSPVDRITIEYGNGVDAPSDPGQQAIGIHDITFCGADADLDVTKTSAVFDDGASLLYNIPGNDVVYTISVTNSGSGSVTSNSIFILDSLPAQTSFFNGDADGPGPGTNPINFIDAGSGLSWSYARDVRYSNQVARPGSFDQCTYTPAPGIDRNVRHICVNPKNAMTGKTGSAAPRFSISFRTKLN